MPFTKGFNFRQSAGFVTDGANEFPVIDTSSYSGGVGWGWTSVTNINTRDRDAGVDRRLAGVHFFLTADLPKTFRVDLPAIGSYGIRLALGDAAAAENWKVVIKDGSTVIATITGPTSNAGKYLDASGVERDYSVWAANNVEINYTFTGTICNVVLSDNGGSHSGLAHFAIRSLTPDPLVAGTIEQVTAARTLAQIVTFDATGGTAPYTYQWHRSLTNGFTPTVGTQVGNGSRLLWDYAVSPGVTYYYKVVVTDSAGSPQTATSAQLTLTTASGSASLEAGFTHLSPTVDTMPIFVDAAAADDTGNGRLPSTAKKLIASGEALIRDGHADYLGIKRGGVFTDQNLGGANWTKFGPSSANPMVVYAYGSIASNRPQLKIASTQNAMLLSGVFSFFRLLGIELYAYTRDPSNPSYGGTTGGMGIVSTATGSDFLIEDCKIHVFKGNVSFDTSGYTGITLNKCVITDSWQDSSIGHSSGLYVNGVTNLAINDCTIDHNGWNETAVNGQQTVFNHDIYLSEHTFNVTIDGNIISRPSSHCMQTRGGAVITNNLLINAPIGINFGGDADVVHTTGCTGSITGNVYIGQIHLGATPLGSFVGFSNVNGVNCSGNWVISLDTNAYEVAIDITNGGASSVGIRDLTIADNVFFGYRAGPRITAGLNVGVVGPLALLNLVVQQNDIQQINPPATVNSSLFFLPNTFSSTHEHFSFNRYFSTDRTTATLFSVNGGNTSFTTWKATYEPTALNQQVVYRDVTRNIATYSTSVGGAGTVTDFLAQARLQRFGNWRSEYSARQPIAYIQYGFSEADTFVHTILPGIKHLPQLNHL